MSSTVERQHQSPARLAHEQRLKELLDRSWRMLIGGQLVGAQGGVTYETASPADGRKLADVPLAQVSDVEAAVGKAKDAVDSEARQSAALGVKTATTWAPRNFGIALIGVLIAALGAYAAFKFGASITPVK